MKLQLTQKKTEARGVESFTFTPVETITWKAGQFMHYVLHHEPTDDRGSDRWFTISSAPFEKYVTITTRLANEKGSTFKNALSNMKISEEIEASEVEGDLILEDVHAEYVFIAGGIGITPFHSILKQADHDGVKLHVTLLYGNRDNDIPFKNELDAFAKNNETISIHYILAPEKIDEGMVKKFVSDISKPIFFVSGPEPMVEALGNILKTIGVTDNHLKQDWFPGYLAE